MQINNAVRFALLLPTQVMLRETQGREADMWLDCAVFPLYLF